MSTMGERKKGEELTRHARRMIGLVGLTLCRGPGGETGDRMSLGLDVVFLDCGSHENVSIELH